MKLSWNQGLAVLCGLSVLALPHTASANPAICDVQVFGAKGDGFSKDTAAIQSAIDACSGHGGIIHFGAGTYVAGTLAMRSNITLNLDQGAVLQASHDIKDYAPIGSFGLGRVYATNQAGEGFLTGLLVGVDVQNVTLEGAGRIEGSSDAFMSAAIHNPNDYDPKQVRNPKDFQGAMVDKDYGPMEPVQSGRPGALIVFFRANNIKVRDVSIIGSPNWTLVFQTAKDVQVSGVRILNNPLMPNNDGIDCMRCSDVHISDGTIRTGDDDLVIVESQDVTVTNMSLYSRSAAVRLESSQRAVLSNMTIEANRGLAVFSSTPLKTPTDGVIFTNIVMRTRLMPGAWWGKGEPIYISVQPCGEAICAGGIHNVVFDGIEADAEAGIVIAGAKGLPVEGVELRNVRLRMVAPDDRLARAIGGNFDKRWTAPTPHEGIVSHNIPALFCSEVAAFQVRDLEIAWAPNMPVYSGPAFSCEHFKGLTIDGLTEVGVAPSQKASLQITDGTGLKTGRLILNHPKRRSKT